MPPHFPTTLENGYNICYPHSDVYAIKNLSFRFCGKIAVFHEGGIIQFGSHEELLQDENGKYYELWNAQAQYYTDKAET